MSFRELRNISEILRSLGYNRLISMESFRTPNFDLVADILNWLVKRFDPNSNIPFQIGTEQERVTFLKFVAQTMYDKARIKLNMKKLYSADGYAVKELLKISSLLYNSMRKNQAEEGDRMEIEFSLASKISDLKATRQTATEITSIGASVFDLLGSEVELREARAKCVARPLDNEDIEANLRNTIRQMNDNIESTRYKLEHLGADEANLKSKIDKKKSDLERNLNRYKSLQGVRPAFMDEYDRIEIELQKQYRLYLEKFKNLEYLENELEQYNRSEQEKFEESQKALKKLRAKDGLEGGRGRRRRDDDDDEISDDPEEDEDELADDDIADEGDDLSGSEAELSPSDGEGVLDDDDDPSDNDNNF
ncbi:hypothetical protein PROFUN_07938 [Planoprotostelium fungivorum]|uniref:Clusterin-associated protein 1 n=1 Tax=Planoprotostelium fungivorum TaxID=1890364 RepID=A0A2P6NL83_9EUKA|nr:hypothetical protein PROFUN_07938 [Planoprotostelium fungivorum]